MTNKFAKENEIITQFGILASLINSNKLPDQVRDEIIALKLFDYPNSIDSDNKGHIGFIATKI